MPIVFWHKRNAGGGWSNAPFCLASWNSSLDLRNEKTIIGAQACKKCDKKLNMGGKRNGLLSAFPELNFRISFLMKLKIMRNSHQSIFIKYLKSWNRRKSLLR